MPTKIKIFDNAEFGNLRTYVEQDGIVLFCASDVAKALGYARPADATMAHCKGSVIYRPLETAGGTQQAKFITEADVLRLIVSSKLPAAQVYESWVFEEVLPSIHKHGGYLTPEKVEEALLNPDTIIRLATDLKEERAKRQQLQTENEAMAPKALFADAVAASETSILIGDLAKLIRQNGVDIGQNRLFAWLRENSWLMKSGSSHNMPTQKGMDMGLFEVKERTFQNPDGSVRITKTTKVTGKGQQYFVNVFLAEKVA